MVSAITAPRRPSGFSPPTVEILRGLMFDLGVQLAAEQDHNGGDPHPHHHADGGAERAVGCVICAKIGDVPRKQNRAHQPPEGRGGAADRKPLPARFAPARPIAIDRGQGDRCKDQQQRPAQNNDRKAQERRKTKGRKDDRSDDDDGERDHQRQESDEREKQRDEVELQKATLLLFVIDDVEGVDDGFHSGVGAPEGYGKPSLQSRG